MLKYKKKKKTVRLFNDAEPIFVTYNIDWDRMITVYGESDIVWEFKEQQVQNYAQEKPGGKRCGWK